MIIAALATLVVLILAFLAICRSIPHTAEEDEEQMEYLKKWRERKNRSEKKGL